MIGKIVLARTSRIRADFIDSGFQTTYFPQNALSALTSVSIQVPQAQVNTIKQVGTRALGGVYKYMYQPATINMRWVCDRTEADAKFRNALTYFNGKTNGRVEFTADDIPINSFSFISSASIEVQGLNPATLELGLTFLNIPDAYSSTFDPVEFIGISFTDIERQITITEANNDEPVISYSYSVFMRGDLVDALEGYRALKFSEATLSQSLSYINDSYTPSFMYNEYALEDTGVIQQNRTLSEEGPRVYSASRQLLMKFTGDSKNVTMGW